MGMRMLRGRGIDRQDVARDEPIAVVNEALVSVSFPNQDPLGRRVRLGTLPSFPTGAPEWITIVGVVANTPTRGLAEATPFPQLFVPMRALRDAAMAPRLNAMSYVIRTTLPPAALMAPVRDAVGEVDANLALAQVRTLQDTLDRASAQMAFTMVLIVIAATVALLLGVIGIYGVMSYIVTDRTSEIGVRLALGAEPGSVASMIVRQGGLVALAGITVGLAAAWGGSRFIASLLYGVSPRDPTVFATTAFTLLGVALVACWLPARRAAGLSPVEALRAE
jgi:predicted lysophospholipase L1 biosynthesis ABC-type transport system permease subunit